MLEGPTRVQLEMIWPGGEMLGNSSNRLGFSPDFFQEVEGTLQVVPLAPGFEGWDLLVQKLWEHKEEIY